MDFRQNRPKKKTLSPVPVLYAYVFSVPIFQDKNLIFLYNGHGEKNFLKKNNSKFWGIYGKALVYGKIYNQ